MHIAFLNPQGNFDPKDSYWTEHPDFGGQLVYVKEIAIAMENLGHKVDIITRQIIDPEWLEFASSIDHYPDAKNLRILRFPCGPKTFLPKEQLWSYLGTEWTQNILKYYHQENQVPDAFTAHYADGGISAAIISSKTKIPFTFTGHSLGAQKLDKLLRTNTSLEQLDSQYHFARRIMAERISMNRASKVITSTNQERFEQYGHIAYKGAIDPADDTRFAVIPPGVNREIFSEVEKPDDKWVDQRINQAIKRDISQKRLSLPLVLASSRLDEKKNHVGIVKAFAKSEQLQHTANLAIAVRNLKDPLRDYHQLNVSERAIFNKIISLIRKSNLWGMVTAFPLNSQKELASAYRVLAKRKSVFALTSLYEPFGLANLEAMSCGLPVVVTQNGGPSESLKEGNREFGVLVDPSNPDDIAQGLLRLLSSKAEWNRFSSAGLKRVISKYTWKKTAEGYLTTIEAIIKNPYQSISTPIHPFFLNPSPQNDIPLSMLANLMGRSK